MFSLIFLFSFLRGKRGNVPTASAMVLCSSSVGEENGHESGRTMEQIADPSVRRSASGRRQLRVNTKRERDSNPYYFPGCGKTIQDVHCGEYNSPYCASVPVEVLLMKTGFVDEVVTPWLPCAPLSTNSWNFRHGDGETFRSDEVGRSSPTRTCSSSTSPPQEGRKRCTDQLRRVTFAQSPNLDNNYAERYASNENRHESVLPR